MTIDVCCSEISSPGISPRISFSYDLNRKTENQDKSLIFDSDFDFCSFVQEQEWSCADELFSNGKILPIEIKKPKPVSSPRSNTDTEKKQLKEFLSMSIEDDEEEDDEEEKSCKSFWQFKRSDSLNSESRSKSRVLIRSLQFLSRSNSTPNPSNSKQPEKPELQKQHSVPQRKSPAKLYPYNYYYGQQRSPALKKCGSYGNANTYRISPVLNISAGTVNLFGLASFFCNTKVKPNKK
ncbi:hypothetical protein M5689_006449 [Euphorbia peplus]|nr:hypothetical protein M5689_006449 [Euphorbia peplus]